MIRINLLPVREIGAEFGRRQDLVLAGVAIGITILALAGIYMIQVRNISNLEAELDTLRQQVEALNAKAKDVSDIGRIVADLKGKLKVIDELNKNRTGPVRIMESLSSATPARLWLTQFREAGGNVTIDGLAVDNLTIAEFLKALSNSPHFDKVELVETAQTDQGGTPLKRFSVNSSLIYRAPASDDNKKETKN